MSLNNESGAKHYKFNTDYSLDGKVILYQAGTELDIRNFDGVDYVYDHELKLFSTESIMAKLHGKVFTRLN